MSVQENSDNTMEATYKSYPSNLSDACWAYLCPYLPAARPGRRPRSVNLRAVVDAIFYVLRSGCAWRMLPGDLPVWQTVYSYFRNWQKAGVWERINRYLREWVRRKAQRKASPSAAIIDLFSRRVVGWSMADHMRTELVPTALESALGQRFPAQVGLLFHSDRGAQHASGDYQAALRHARISCSMSRRGNCWDNAVAESFFGTLKTELIHPTAFLTRAAAKTTIVEWIEVFYNRQRLYSTIGYLSPAQFEEQCWDALDHPRAA